MVTFLLLCGLGVAAFVVLGLLALPIFVVGGVVWLVTLPLRLLFKLVFGLGGALLGMVLAPLVMVVVAIALVVAVVAAVLALLAPLAPFALLGLFAWALYRLAAPRPTAPPPPPPGLWS